MDSSGVRYFAQGHFNMQTRGSRDSNQQLSLCACCSHRCRVVLVPSGADHLTKNLQPISADVSCCVDGLLRHHLAVNEHFGARLTDGEVKLQRRKTKDYITLTRLKFVLEVQQVLRQVLVIKKQSLLISLMIMTPHKHQQHLEAVQTSRPVERRRTAPSSCEAATWPSCSSCLSVQRITQSAHGHSVR